MTALGNEHSMQLIKREIDQHVSMQLWPVNMHTTECLSRFIMDSLWPHGYDGYLETLRLQIYDEANRT